jgi:hypothetical protein
VARCLRINPLFNVVCRTPYGVPAGVQAAGQSSPGEVVAPLDSFCARPSIRMWLYEPPSTPLYTHVLSNLYPHYPCIKSRTNEASCPGIR